MHRATPHRALPPASQDPRDDRHYEITREFRLATAKCTGAVEPRAAADRCGGPGPVSAEPPDDNRRYLESTMTLTNRERDIIQLLAKGFVQKEVADRLHISVQTVKA